MKPMIKRLAAVALLLFASLFLEVVLAQEPPHPPGQGHGQSGNQPANGSAPIGGGVVLLIVSAAGYGIVKSGSYSKTVSEEQTGNS